MSGTGAGPGPCVVLVTGVMASGESTVAQALAERLPRAAHVRGDVFRRMIVSGREEMLPDPSPGALGRSLREDTPRLGLWLDTSDQTPEETVDAILASLPSARLP
ncbi:hypothetical protein ACFSJS_04325 [Streptomyces desertarenae]|uniref:Phosphotransferase n=1 Tax=Streptomyces desertarenae TaxID=2666184 RepID=A0ABW4PFQ1_9ACTN